MGETAGPSDFLGELGLEFEYPTLGSRTATLIEALHNRYVNGPPLSESDIKIARSLFYILGNR